MYTRQNAVDPSGPWAAPVLWYARAVGAMQQLPLDNPQSWAFFAAMHGMDAGLWSQLGLPIVPMPTSAVQQTFWAQCQHQSWYFLPWHRGYLLALEACVRAQVAKLGGPTTWALPYWNYFNPGQNQLPAEFASQTWPDGGTNPLFIAARYGPQNDGNVIVPLQQVNLKALSDSTFTGTDGGGDPGFGGVDTGFSHSGGTSGRIEDQPHNAVHSLVGGSDPNSQLPGLMSDPDTAGYDPIFYLHHANIDRLWAVWSQNPATNADPTDPNWVNGPANTGERAFAMPMPDGSTWNYTPGLMTSITTLGYTYDDLSPNAPPPSPAARLTRLGFTNNTGGAS